VTGGAADDSWVYRELVVSYGTELIGELIVSYGLRRAVVGNER